ncbi:MAG: hypothetical protein IE883_02065 [Epsilonproteobacteria bacterium]|nr:hypothetical protein [Campylobacterota bacterium]
MFRYLIYMTILATALFGEGGAPMMTDGTGTPSDGKWELNVGLKLEDTQGDKRYEAPILDLNYGLGDRIQLKIESTYISLDNDESSERGIGNAKVGAKWRFYENDTFALSIYPQYTFAPVRKNIEKSLADVDEAWFLPLEMSKQFGSIGVTAEVGYLILSHDQDWIKSGIVAGYQSTEALEFLVELYRSAKSKGEEESIFLNTGLTYVFTPNVNALFSIGKEIKSPSSTNKELMFIGLQFLF